MVTPDREQEHQGGDPRPRLGLKFHRGTAVAKVAIAGKLAVRLYWMLRKQSSPVPPARRQGSRNIPSSYALSWAACHHQRLDRSHEYEPVSDEFLAHRGSSSIRSAI